LYVCVYIKNECILFFIMFNALFILHCIQCRFVCRLLPRREILAPFLPLPFLCLRDRLFDLLRLRVRLPPTVVDVVVAAAVAAGAAVVAAGAGAATVAGDAGATVATGAAAAATGAAAVAAGATVVVAGVAGAADFAVANKSGGANFAVANKSGGAGADMGAGVPFLKKHVYV
jgi:hypothetical protein